MRSSSTSLLGWRAVSAICLSAMLGAGCDTIRDEPGRWTPERLYAEAKEEAAIGNWEKAAQYYERLEGRAAGQVLAEQAQIERAYALWKANEKAQALTALERFIKLRPSSPALDYAYYLQGLINFNDNIGLFGNIIGQDLSERDQQASRDAFQSFRQVVEQFPQSTYAEDARQHMAYIVNVLANYEVHVARYYFRRGAYVAAANRAQQTVQEFQQSPATEEALYILAQSYDRLGLTVLRDDANRVLQKSFPKSTLAGLGDKKSAWWRIW